jgi:hypothetical protein
MSSFLPPPYDTLIIPVIVVAVVVLAGSYFFGMLKGRSDRRSRAGKADGSRLVTASGRVKNLSDEENAELRALMWADWEKIEPAQVERYKELMRKGGFSEMIIEFNIKNYTRKKYRTLTVDILHEIPDEDLTSTLFDHVTFKIGEHTGEGGMDEPTFIRTLSPGFQAFWSTTILEGEVDNGGFSQFFWNASRVYGLDAIEGYKRLGAHDKAEIVEEAVKKAVDNADEYTRLRETGTLEAYQEWDKASDSDFRELEHRYGKSPDDLDALVVQYVRSHPEEFVGE